jgi:hypothetical protein
VLARKNVLQQGACSKMRVPCCLCFATFTMMHVLTSLFLPFLSWIAIFFQKIFYRA